MDGKCKIIIAWGQDKHKAVSTQFTLLNETM